MNTTGKIVTAVLAAAGGAALGVLFAPDKGKETRRKIAYKREELTDKLEDKMGDLKETISGKLKGAKTELGEQKWKAKQAVAEVTGVDETTDSYLSSEENGEFSSVAPI